MAEEDDFFDELLKPKKLKKSNNLLDNLYAIPIKDKGQNRPTFQYYDPNIYQQADLLFCLKTYNVNMHLLYQM